MFFIIHFKPKNICGFYLFSHTTQHTSVAMTMQNATPILGRDKTTQNLSRGNINDSCQKWHDYQLQHYLTANKSFITL